jgi:hypothetical protein
MLVLLCDECREEEGGGCQVICELCEGKGRRVAGVGGDALAGKVDN